MDRMGETIVEQMEVHVKGVFRVVQRNLRQRGRNEGSGRDYGQPESGDGENEAGRQT